jgi:hypothetical protein
MEMIEVLLKDPPFWGASTLFLFSFSVFIWSAVGLRTRASSTVRKNPSLASRDFPAVAAPVVVEKKSLWTFPPPELPPEFPPNMESTLKTPTASTTGKPQGVRPVAPPQPPNSPLLPAQGDSTIVLSMMEDKFTELSKRLTALEHVKKDAAPPAYLDPLLKRVQEMETEMKNLKFGFTQLAATQNAININDVTAKIQSIQKMLENLTGGTDVSKPS